VKELLLGLVQVKELPFDLVELELKELDQVEVAE
jgi:hypothetical protein